MYQAGAKAKANKLFEPDQTSQPDAAAPENVPVPAAATKLAKDQGFDIPPDFMQQAANDLGADAAPADIVIRAFKASKGQAPPAPAHVTPPDEGTPIGNAWSDQADKLVKEYVDMGIPEEQAIYHAADVMEQGDLDRPPKGQGLEAKFMPSPHPDSIKEAAIKDANTGEEFTSSFPYGASHGMILDEHGHKLSESEPILGYKTNKGDFVNREKAAELAIRHKQVRPDSSAIIEHGDRKFLGAEGFDVLKKIHAGCTQHAKIQEVVRR